MTPSIGTSHSNEVILGISGDASAVKAAVLEASGRSGTAHRNGKLSEIPECHIFNTDPKIFLTEYKEKACALRSTCPSVK